MNFGGIGRERKNCYKALKKKELRDFLKILKIFEYFPLFFIIFDFFALILPFFGARRQKNMREICYWEKQEKDSQPQGGVIRTVESRKVRRRLPKAEEPPGREKRSVKIKENFCKKVL